MPGEESLMTEAEHLETAVAVARKIGDGWSEAWAICGLGAVSYYGLGDLPTAQDRFTRSLDLFRRLGDLFGSGRALNGLNFVALARGDFALARSAAEEYHAISLALGDRSSTANALAALGRADTALGNLVKASSELTAALAIYRDVDDKTGILLTLVDLTYLALHSGDLVRAQELAVQSLEVGRTAGDPGNLSLCFLAIGTAALERRDPPSARADLIESLLLSQENARQVELTATLDGFAHLAALEGTPERAICLAGAGAAVRARQGMRASPVARERLESALRDARSTLGEDASAGAWARGQAMSTEQMIAYALEGR
jgi:tetratricopeptide (TPR) repeat protein